MIALRNTASGTAHPRATARRRGAYLALLVGALVLSMPSSPAFAFTSPATVDLGATGGTFAVLAATTVTNTGLTVVSSDVDAVGNLGVSPGTAITGFGPGVVSLPGTTHAAGAYAAAAKADITAAYIDAAARTPDQTFPAITDIGGMTFTPGVYNDPSSFAITGDVTLNAQGDPAAVFIFQAGSTLVTASASHVLLTNGAQAANVFWQVGSSATLGTNSFFRGTILASASITVTTGVNVQGRLFAGSAAVTLDSDTINATAAAPISGVPQAPLFGPAAWAVTLAAFVSGMAVLMFRRRRPAQVR
ncbi:MAG: hypothetical protein QOG22_2382 [Pseudonocardiales bacterium]|nr:hypothetical protein [Pseudonocardiales bacterium]